MGGYARAILVNSARNLERLRLARKQIGWELERDRHLRGFYYRLQLRQSTAHTTGVVLHHSDGELLTACTTETPISSRLYSNTDASAAENVGRVLAARCLRAGITKMQQPYSEETIQANEKVRLFIGAMEDGGVCLKEDDFIEPTYADDSKFHFVEEYKIPQT